MELSNTVGMSLSEATKPLLVVSRLVGMNPISHWYKIYTVFIIVIEISIMSYVWQYYASLDLNNYYFNILVHALEDVIRITSLVVILSLSLLDKNRYIVPLKELASIDRSLMTLSGSIDNRGTYRFQISLVIYIGLLILLFGLVKFSLRILPETDDLVIGIIIWGSFYNLVVLVICAVADCLFVSTLSIIRRRYREINSIIHRARMCESYSRVHALQVFSARSGNDVSGHLRILRKRYHDLWRIAIRVNGAYSLHLLVGATSSLALIISNLWGSYTAFMSSNGTTFYDTIDGVIWALFNVSRIYFLVEASESTVTETKATSVMLQELDMNRDHDLVTKGQIREFLTQLRVNDLKFTACGFFDFDFTLICGILGAACTYLVILIQMGDFNSCAITGRFNESLHFTDKNQ